MRNILAKISLPLLTTMACSTAAFAVDGDIIKKTTPIVTEKTAYSDDKACDKARKGHPEECKKLPLNDGFENYYSCELEEGDKEKLGDGDPNDPFDISCEVTSQCTCSVFVEDATSVRLGEYDELEEELDF